MGKVGCPELPLQWDQTKNVRWKVALPIRRRYALKGWPFTTAR